MLDARPHPRPIGRDLYTLRLVTPRGELVILIDGTVGFSEDGQLPISILHDWVFYLGCAVLWSVADAQAVERRERAKAEAAQHPPR